METSAIALWFVPLIWALQIEPIDEHEDPYSLVPIPTINQLLSSHSIDPNRCEVQTAWHSFFRGIFERQSHGRAGVDRGGEVKVP